MPIDGIPSTSGRDPEAGRVPPMPEPGRPRNHAEAGPLAEAARLRAVLAALDELLAQPDLGGPNIALGTTGDGAAPLDGPVVPNVTFESVMLSRARKGDPAVQQVPPGQAGTMEVPEGQKSTMLVHPLGGGSVLGIVSLFPNGQRSVSLAHLPASDTAAPDMVAQIDAHHAPRGGPAMRVALTLAPEGSEEAAAAMASMMQAVRTRLRGIHTHALTYRPEEAEGDADMFTVYVGVESSSVVIYQGVLQGGCTVQRASAAD